MAYCKCISTVKTGDGLSKVTEYISDKRKTQKPKTQEQAVPSNSTPYIPYITYDFEYEDGRSMRRALDYIADDEKTRNKRFLDSTMDKSDDEKELFVTGIGCTRDNAYTVMLNCQKAARRKRSVNLCYHYVQSFLEGEKEIDPDTGEMMSGAAMYHNTAPDSKATKHSLLKADVDNAMRTVS